jgi:hypothetical protein
LEATLGRHNVAQGAVGISDGIYIICKPRAAKTRGTRSVLGEDGAFSEAKVRREITIALADSAWIVLEGVSVVLGATLEDEGNLDGVGHAANVKTEAIAL